MRLNSTSSKVLIATAMVLASLGSVAIALASDSPEQEGDEQPIAIDPADLPPDPCAPIFEGDDSGGPNRITRHGIGSDRTPAFLYENYTHGALYCLSDGLTGEIQAVYQEFWQDGEVVARWMLTNPRSGTPRHWEEYLRSLESGPRSSGMDLVQQRPDAFLAVLDSGENAQLREHARAHANGKTPDVSLWEQVRGPLAEHHRERQNAQPPGHDPAGEPSDEHSH